MILMRVKDESQLADVIRDIRIETEDFNNNGGRLYDLNFSIGTAVCEKKDTMDSFLARMDSAMYDEKKNNSHCQ